MARYPRADWRPLSTNGHPAAMARYDVVCLHTMVGNLTGTDRMFKDNGWSGTESHFGVGGPWGDNKDGQVYQWVDTRYRADANLEGNPRLISIETGDNAPRLASQILPWTERQLDAIVALVTWICRTHDIPPVLIRDSKPGTRGIGYHRLGITHSEGVGVPGYRVAGGELWSSARGKECPGDARVAQMSQIVDRVKAALEPEEEFVMATKAEVKAALREVLADKDVITVIARELFKADVIKAPTAARAEDPENENWQLRSYLDRIVTNTEPEPPAPPVN